jgi:hypothetical protein
MLGGEKSARIDANRTPSRTRTGLAGAFFLALFTISIACPALAAPQVEVKMLARPESVTVGARLELEIRVDSVGGRIDRVDLPELPGFTVLGHRRSSPVRFQFGMRSGAQVEATEIHQFTLRADAPGSFEIAAPVAIVEGARYEGAPVRIDVAGSTDDFPSPAQSGPDDPAVQEPVSTPLDEVFDARAFLRTSVDRDEAFVGEQITFEVELYTRVGGSPRFTKEPSTDGFWVHDLLDPNRPPAERREVVKGVPFHVYTIKRVAAFPMRAGKLVIGAPTLEFASTSAFGLVRGDKLVRHGKPVNVEVKPLPDGTPRTALVGQFTMRSDVDRRTLRVGEAATLTVVVEGRGHVRDVELSIPKTRGVRVLAPEVDTSTTIRGGKVHGKREARFLIIAEEPGTRRIPGFAVHAFDPATETTTRLATPGVMLQVTDDAGALPDLPDDDAEPDEPSDPGSLGALRGRSELRRQAPTLAERPAFLGWLAAPPALLVLALALRTLVRKRRTERGRRERERRHQRLLVEARRHRRHGDAPGLYSALASAIHAALEELLGKSARGLTHRELEGSLEAHGAPRDLIVRTIEELEGLDFARFAAESTQPEEMDRAMNRIATILDRIEALKKRGGA